MSRRSCGSTDPRKNPLEGLVRQALARLTKDETLTEEGMRKAWEAAAGAGAAVHSTPVSLRKARLIVNVDGSSWLYELTMRKPEIMRNIGGKIGTRPVKSLQFRIGEIGQEGRPHGE